MNENYLITKVIIADSVEANFVFDTGSHTAFAFDSTFAINSGLVKIDRSLIDKLSKRREYKT